MTTCALVSTNLTDGSVTFWIDGVRWEYIFPLNDHVRKTVVIAKKSQLAALNYAKRWKMREVKHD
jgi:hypothetical protein